MLEIHGLERLLDFASYENAKLVYLSTSYVFDGESGNYSEKSPHNPISEYGRQKSQAESLIKSSDVNALVLRLDKIVGSDPLCSHLFTEWVAQIKSNMIIPCIIDQIFAPTSVTDVAQGILAAIKFDLTGVYHHANPENFKRSDLARLFLKSMEMEGRVVEKDGREFGIQESRPKNSSLDANKFIAATDFLYTAMLDELSTFSRAAAFK
jgi:dTDP-4-dehydrorhamnose reductase